MIAEANLFNFIESEGGKMRSESGNGVKVARKDVAKFIRTHYAEKDWKIFKDEHELKGYKKQDILNIFIEQKIYQNSISSLKRKYSLTDNIFIGIDPLADKNRYGGALKDKKWKNERNEKEKELFNNSTSINDALSSTFSARWDTDPVKIKFGKDTLRINWDVDSDWDYYSKSYGKPKNTYSGRRVEKIELQKDENGLLRVVVTKTAFIDSFRGQFLINAIADIYNLEKIKVSRGLKRVQLNDYFKVKKLHKIGDAELYSRSLAGVIIDYCAVFKKFAYHDPEIKYAFYGLKNKIADKKLHEAEKLDFAYAKKVGFCETGIRQFCFDNNISVDSEFTRQELRNVVIQTQNRKVNCEKYQQELRKIGIVLNCK